MFIARQPILDQDKNLFAYELLYRKDVNTDNYTEFDGNKATAEVIIGGLNSIGFNELTDGKKAFINFTEKLLQEKIPVVIPKNLIGIEILETVKATEKVVEKCRELKKEGYLIILDDFLFRKELSPLIELADIIKVDFIDASKGEINAILKNVKHQKLLAEKIETVESFKQARKLNFNYFQGYFFSKPETVTTQELPAYKINYLNLLAEINKEEPDFVKMENIIKKDLSMSYALLKLINSAYFGMKSKVNSVKQVLTLFGIGKIRKWLTLYLMCGFSKKKPNILFKTALVRANFAEHIASLLGLRNNKFDFYILGLLSVIDAFFDMSLAKILREIAVPTMIKNALLKYEGISGQVIKLITYYERGNWKEVEKIASNLNLNGDLLMDQYIKALKDINETIKTIEIAF